MPAKSTVISLSLGTLATEFGLTRDVLRRMLAEASVAPAGKSAGHPVYRLRDAFRAVQRQQQPEQLNPHARLALARATLVEDDIRTRRGDLCESIDVASEWARVMKIIAMELDTLPDTIERDCGATPAQLELIERTLDRVREEMHAKITTPETAAA